MITVEGTCPACQKEFDTAKGVEFRTTEDGIETCKVASQWGQTTLHVSPGGGYLSKFIPDSAKIGEQPSCQIIIIP